MRGIALAGLGLLLSGCASVAAVSPNGGIVENAGSAKTAMAKAESHCQESGRTAKAGSYDALMGTLVFECVAR